MVVVNKGEDLLPGMRFRPTEEELVGFFLLNKVMQTFPSDCFIEEKNIYADAPWNVFTDNQNWSKLNAESVMNNKKKKQFYAFVKLKKNGKNVVRTVGCGQWHGQTGPKPVRKEYGNEIIGWKKMLTFKLLDKNGEGVSKLENNEGRWIMHEYSLDKNFLKKWLKNNVVFSDHEELVICHITRDYKGVREFNKLLVDDQDNHAMKEGIALNNIQENPRPPLVIEREANGSSFFLIQQQDYDRAMEEGIAPNIQKSLKPPLIINECQANGSSCFLIQQEDDRAMEEEIVLNIQENPRLPLMIEREADGSSCFLMQQQDDEQLKEEQEVIQDFVSNNGPIQENLDFDFNLYLAELEKVVLGDDDIPSNNDQLGKRNSTTEEGNPRANKKSRLS